LTKIILFNGPKKAGKDTAIDYLMDTFRGDSIVRKECKDQLYKLVPLMFNIEEGDYWYWYANRDEKEVPREEFSIFLSPEDLDTFEGILKESVKVVGLTYPIECHLSVRQAMIYVSEMICKPSFGQDYFGRIRAESVTENDSVVVDGSCGFMEELVPLADKFYDKLDDITVIKVHREGCDFSGDSRDYLSDEQIKDLGFKVVDVYNDGTEKEFLDKIKDIYLELNCLSGDILWKK
jgi:hypothetical protein